MVQLSTNTKQLILNLNNVNKSREINDKGFISRSILNKKKLIN